MRPHAIVALLVLASCGDTPDLRIDPMVPEPRPAAGTFHLVNRFELAAASMVPGTAGEAFTLLDGLGNRPATTLLALADAAGAPAAGIVASALPGEVESRLDEWMKAYLTSAQEGNSSSAYAEIVKLNGQIQSVLVSFALHSDLALSSGADPTSAHSPRALVFFQDTSPVTVQVPFIEVAAARGVRATISWSSSAEAAAGNSEMTIEDHAMGIPFGRYAVSALNIALQEALGARDLAAALAQLVDCSAMAASVANRCVGPLCVGHAAELSAVCTAGLGRAASEIEAAMGALDFKAIHFQSGRARGSGCFATEGAPAAPDRLSDGVWSVTVDLGSGEKPASATFEGTAAPEHPPYAPSGLAPGRDDQSSTSQTTSFP